MNPERDASDRDARRRRVDRLFQRALDLPPDERTAFLRDAADGDEELRGAVENLLRVADESEGFLETPIEALDDLAFAAFATPGPDADTPPEESAGDGPEDTRVGRRIGPYRLIRRLGRGGMATVYLAERCDGQFEQRVAVKLIRRGLDTDDVVRRFLAERQILSALDHPNIGRLLDGGSTEDGLPYLVMELVDGLPITEFADERALGIEDRLRLFRNVCHAVQFAHQKLVIHRDLKPSNILVRGDGDVKLLDFGIAKLLEGDGGDRTRTGRQMLTPQYASPEQVRGEAITTASDVYQLGILLCRLLSGQRPYEVDGLSPAVVEAKIADATPERPSRLVTPEAAAARGLGPRRLARRLEGDLDAIVQKALRPDPDDRYTTAEALAADVGRHLAGLPVDAARGALAYRARKFVRRHAAALTAAALVFVLLAGATIALAIQRGRALESARRAELASSFLASVFQDVDPLAGVGDTMSARTLLARGARRVESELAGQPELQAELYGVIGNALANLGRLDEAVEILRSRLHFAREAYGDGGEELEAALVDYATTLSSAGNVADAVPPLEELVELRLARLGPDAVEVGQAYVTLATRVRDVIGADSAEVLLRKGLAVPGLDPEGESATAMQLSLAYVLRAQGRLDEAESIYRSSIPRYRTFDPEPGELALHINNLAFTLRTRGAFDEAATLYREAHDVYAGAYGDGHPTSLMFLGNLASALDNAGRPEEVLAVQREQVAAAREQWPGGHWRVAAALRSLGISQLKYGRAGASAESLRESVEGFTSALGPIHSWTATARAWLGAALLEEDEADAGTQFDQAIQDLRVYRDSYGIQDQAPPILQLAELLEARGRTRDAVRLRDLFPESE